MSFKWMLRALNAAVLLLAACDAGSTPRPGVQDSTTPLSQATLDDQRVVAILGGDTAYISSAGTLVWASSTVGRRNLRWESTSLYGGVPQARLIYFDEDSLPDLFWTLQFEEFLGGVLLLAVGETAHRYLFRSPGTDCAVPELRDIDSDGHLELIEFAVGALDRAECSGDPIADVCKERFLTDWLIVHRLEDGELVQITPSEFYSDLAQRYEGDAQTLRDELGMQGNALSPRCNASMATTLERLADSALRIARIGS